MAGFGHGDFGVGPFGEADWSRLALWEQLPYRVRQVDELQGDDALRNFILSIQPSFDYLRWKIRTAFQLQDPLEVRTRWNEWSLLEIYAATATVDDDGVTPLVKLDIIGDMEDVGWSWILESDDKLFTVAKVRKWERIDGTTDGTIYLRGSVLPSTGTDKIFRPQAQMPFLAAGYGIINDGYDPDKYQRSAVENAIQWLNLKGTEKGYRVRGLTGGFSITTGALYRISLGWASSLPVDRVYEIPAGSGKWYTDLQPLFARFDEVRGDCIPVDTRCEDLVGTAAELSFSRNVNTVVPGVAHTDPKDTYTLTMDANVLPMVDPENWQLVDSNSQVHWIEEITSPTTYKVAGTVLPATGPCTVRYVCQEARDCGWCKSNKVRMTVEITAEYWAEISANPGDAIERITEKIEQTKPIHVEIVQFVFITVHPVGPIMTLTMTIKETTEAYAGVGKYDEILGDAMIVDDDDDWTVTDTH